MNKKLVVGIVVFLAILVGGIAVWLAIPIEEESSRMFEDREPPSLFAKSDYKIEERADGKYIVIDKIGFSAKVPDGWDINIEGSDDGVVGGIITLDSENIEFFDVVIKGCKIMLMSGSSVLEIAELKNKITTLKNNPEENNKIKDDYKFVLKKISDKEVVEYFTKNTKYHLLGYMRGIGIIIDDKKIVSANINYQKDFTEQCEPIWENFVNSIEIK